MEYEAIRAGGLAVKQRAQELFAEIAPIYNAVMGWQLDGANESLPTPATVKAQILAYDAISKGALTILPELRIIKASTEESTGEAELGASFLEALFAMQSINDEISETGEDALVTDAAVRGALTGLEENASLAYAVIDHAHATAYSDQIIMSTESLEPAAQENKAILFAQKIFVEGFGNTAETRLLLHGTAYEPLENTAMGGAAETMTNNGVTFSDAIIKSGFGATTLFFDGASDIQVPSDNFNLGTSEFTVDLWAYPTNLSTDRAIFSLCQNGILLFSGSYGGISAYSDACGQINSDYNVFTLNAWHHIAFCRAGQYFRLFVNGVLQGYNISASPVTFSAVPLAIGKDFWVGKSPFVGHMTEIRVSVTADYPTDDAFSPPMLPYASATSQVLKIKFADGTVRQLASAVE